MGVNQLLWVLVQAEEEILEIFDGFFKVATSCIVLKAALHVDAFDFLLKQIGLVEEEDDRGVVEPGAIADLLEERDGFVHSIDPLIFIQLQIELADGDTKDECGDILKAMDPLFPLASLPSDVDHLPWDTAQIESDFSDPCGSGSGT